MNVGSVGWRCDCGKTVTLKGMQILKLSKKFGLNL